MVIYLRKLGVNNVTREVIVNDLRSNELEKQTKLLAINAGKILFKKGDYIFGR